jgi:antitoxin HicB
MIYFARLHRSKGSYWTEFPEFKTPGSEGSTLDEVTTNSKEALEGLLESLYDRECKIPPPKARRGKNWLPIEVDDSIAVPIVLRQLRLAHGLTLKQMAKKLDTSYQSYQALETLRRANPTLKTLRKVAEAFEVPVVELLQKIA